MRDTKDPLDLSPLANDYDIVGELDGTDGARRYVATAMGDASKRRDDQPGVLITIYTTPEGDEANALSHLAADTQLLARLAHRRLIPVIEGRWIGDDAFAVVTRRVSESSLAQRLATGETFTTPRIAAILRDVNGLLEWARGQQVVHRSVTADTVFLEPKTDRVRVAFAVAPIRRIRHSAEDDDARTIARLAMAMLTGEQDPQAYEGKSLAELRPGLPERLDAATGVLLSEKNAGTPSDVAAYIAMIGMADPLAAGESEAGRIRAEMTEEQRVEREALATERFNFDLMMERERQTLADDRAELERTIAAERERLEQAATEERTKLQRALEEDRAALLAKRAELERIVAEQRAEMERAAAQDRQQIEQLRAELKRAGELEIETKRQTALDDLGDEESTLDRDDLAVPRFLPPAFAPLEALEFDDATPVLSDDAIDFAPPRALVETLDEVSEYSRTPGPTTKQRWVVLAVAVIAITAVVGGSAAILGRRTPVQRAAVTSATNARDAAVPIVAAPVVVAAPADSLGTAAANADSITALASARWMDSVRTANPLVASIRRPMSVASPATTTTTTSQSPQQRTVRDTTPRRAIMSVTDSIFNFRVTTPATRGTTTRPDTLRRPGTPRFR